MATIRLTSAQEQLLRFAVRDGYLSDQDLTTFARTVLASVSGAS